LAWPSNILILLNFSVRLDRIETSRAFSSKNTEKHGPFGTIAKAFRERKGKSPKNTAKMRFFRFGMKKTR